MKKTLVVVLISFVSISSHAQTLKGVLGKFGKQDSTSQRTLNDIVKTATGSKKDSLSGNDIVSGLKEALTVGTERGVASVSSVDGFFKNAALKILMPEEARNAEQKLRSLGFGKQVDNAILSMNRAAEDASKKAVPFFVNAIKQMNFNDAVSILRGGDSAATTFLRTKTTADLTKAFKPVIDESLAKVDATNYWNTAFTTYNKFSSNKVNPDLSAYVTEKALAGIFYQIGLEEQKIRKDPLARTSDILKQVFSNRY